MENAALTAKLVEFAALELSIYGLLAAALVAGLHQIVRDKVLGS